MKSRIMNGYDVLIRIRLIPLRPLSNGVAEGLSRCE